MSSSSSPTEPTGKQSQSSRLSTRLCQLAKDGRRLNDDSRDSDKTIAESMCEVIEYAKEVFKPLGGTIEHQKSISLFECQEYFHRAGGPEPNPENKKVSMKPDGGILFLIQNGKRVPILIVEIKDQGTNDKLFAEKKKRQATGNAIERGAKNIRGAEMLFCDTSIFPYLLFASGCDFHPCETIAKRIEMMNMGFPNHFIEITPKLTEESFTEKLTSVTNALDIKKKCGKNIASVFVKAHKWDEMAHGSSTWKQPEIVQLCKKAIDKVFESFTS